ncbi:uncharacterized protein UTRI_01707 [Ustilago trichophora]|uniref:ER membrane protein complex subunit 10 n=1 Tax=Ustilago trichophora TaxID=86804 RepID=A0A5C3E0U9_9BASI|nr:uncharacterized protein UTRI_01707 [Ustilago trichophora]
MRKTLPLLFAVALGLPDLAAAQTYNLLHRVATFESTPAWEVRGTFELPLTIVGNNVSSHLVTSTLNSAQVAALQSKAQAEDASGLWYQLAISPTSSSIGEEVQLQTSVRLCHLRQSHPELPTLDDEVSLTTRSSSTSDGTLITGLSYRILDITLDSSSCPLPSNHKISLVRAEAKKQRQRELARRSNRGQKPPPPSKTSTELKLNTKLNVKPATTLAKVTLKQALPTNEDGTVQTPPPEKSFLQKYWMYLIPVVILLIMPPGDDERKDGAEGHASSEHPGTGMGAKKLN